jgi:hypothetical protein
MSTVSPKEKNMLMVTAVIVLYAFAALSFKKQVANWKAAQRVYATAQKKYGEESALIAARTMGGPYDPRARTDAGFPYEKDVDTHGLTSGFGGPRDA